MEKIKSIVFITVLVILFVTGAILLGIDIRRDQITKDKIQRMQFVKDSLQIELLKQNLIKNEK
jgi:hypothetical protein